ncbi:MAG: imidazoleglycerol-phosphate dehydratase HisB [Miniphocaeibacter sp.]|uniref:imidazoleglycerol-phosphate dehydratase HisB n=1 Tax=Miniphocaeibacter sp. TaxID=3100973 RepID=UPI0017F585A9|nr:imidazoleglycerol-phosphate dehydratase HisB [Gallicola sp.]
MNRIASVERNTLETNIKIELDIDGNGLLKGKTGIGFFDHMLNLLAKHGNFNLQIYTKGDTYIDNHHLIEDIGIVLGECLLKALGNKAGINRYGSFTCPMDETLTTVDLDLSGRGYLVYNVKLSRDKVGEFETEMLKEFLYALAINGKFNLHINTHYGENDHHIIESIFKAMGRALRIACKIEEGNTDIPSTKGVI